MAQNLLADYAEKEHLMKQLQEQLQRLEGDPRLQTELEFKGKLETLMKDYDKSTADVLELISPQRVGTTHQPSRARRKRKLKVYQNPETNEVVETRGGNQKTLKAWKDEYGEETVESWLVRTEE